MRWKPSSPANRVNKGSLPSATGFGSCAFFLCLPPCRMLNGGVACTYTTCSHPPTRYSHLIKGGYSLEASQSGLSCYPPPFAVRPILSAQLPPKPHALAQHGKAARQQAPHNRPFKLPWPLFDCRHSPTSNRSANPMASRQVIPYSKMMGISHSDLQLLVDTEIAAYVTPKLPQDAMGSALPQSWFSERLIEMRAALVPPHDAKIRDGDDETGEVVIKDVIIVVDDGIWVIIAYDPKACTFILAAHDTDQDQVRGVDAVSVGIRGNAVDCFLAA
jgi:hypothetical protein